MTTTPKSTGGFHGSEFKSQSGHSLRSPESRHHPREAASRLPPPAAVLLPCVLLLQDAVRPIEVPRGRWTQASQLPDGLAHGAGVVRQTLDVLEGQVDDLIAAGIAVKMPAGEALEAGLVGDATLAVRQVGAQRQGAGQGAALQAAGLAGAQLSGRPEREREQDVKTA